MKRKLIGSLIAASSMAFPMMSSAATTVNGGTINFTGEVVNAACAVDVNSSNMNVALGQVRTAKLSSLGETSSPVGFNIVLLDCDPTVSAQASVAFDGVATGSTGGIARNDVLALSSNSASGSATNVGIQLFSGTDTTPLKIDGSTYTTAKDLSAGRNVLSFQAKYYALGAAGPGSANAVADFKVQYQ